MNKKKYTSPSLKIVVLNNKDIICTSGSFMSSMKVSGTEVGSFDGDDEDIRDIWGTQW